MIDSIKSTAVVVGFLFCLSIAYYLSFWSHFDIDVFQYIALEDIIKGVAYPMRYAGFLMLGIIVYIIYIVSITEFGFDKKTRKENTPVLIILISTAIALVFYLLVYYNKVDGNAALIGWVLSIVTGVFFLFLYIAADRIHNKNKKEALDSGEPFDDKHPVVEFLNAILIISVVFLFISAITSGQSDAKDVLEGRNFDYVMIQNFPKDKVITNQPYLILLGVVSDKSIFIDCSHTEHFFIDKEDIRTLQTRHFNSSDTLSVRQFQRNLFKNKTL